MNILVLGGMGFLGTRLVQELSKNHMVCVADCIEGTFQNYYKVNVSDTDTIINIIKEKKIQVIMHLISSLLPASGIEKFFFDIQNIYIPSLALLNYCAENRVKFVYFSSGGAIYGNQKEIFNECTKREPVSYYGLSKLNFENAIAFFHNTKELEYLIIRPSNPYGYGQNIYGKQGIIAVIIGKILKNESLQIWGDGSAVKDFIYIDDFVFYVTSMIECNAAWNQTFNIGTGIGISVNEILEIFRENNIPLPKIEYIAESKADINHMVLDCTKVQKMFPHTLVPLKVGIKAFWDRIIEK